MDPLWDMYRRRSRGWTYDSNIRVHTKIEVGPHFKLPSATSHVINCAEDTFGSKWFKSMYPDRYVCLNAIDSPDTDILTWYPEFETAMNSFLSDPACTLVYVHCECGINRSAFLVLAFMCKKFGYPFDTLVKSMTSQRPCVFTNKSFRKQVESYIKKHQ